MDRISKLIDEIREYGINNNVPIMSVETINTIIKIIEENNIKSKGVKFLSGLRDILS